MEQEEEKENNAVQPLAASGDEASTNRDGITSTDTKRLRQVGLPLGELLEKACSDVKVDAYTDFKWPEERVHTEKVAQELLQKRVLFIESFTETWALRAIQRLATVMYTMTGDGGLLILSNNGTTELDFGFWINERPLSCPVVIVMPTNRYDFFQKFTTQKHAQYVLGTLIPELHRLNLFIVCQLSANGAGQERLSGLSGWMKQAYAVWNVPVIQLELNRCFGQSGPPQYKLIQGTIEKYGSYAVGWELINRSYKPTDELNTLLETHIIESASEVQNRKKALVSLVNNRGFLPKLLVFCGSFFHGLHYKDFYQLVARLLQEEEVDMAPVADAPGLSHQFTLRQQWERDADHFLRECDLVTTRKDGNHRVEFSVPGLPELMADYIANERYPFFHRVYRNFEQASLMTNLNLSKDLEKSLILLFARAARMDTVHYSAEWLKNEVCTLWEEYSKELPDRLESYDELFAYLDEKEFFGELVLKRVPLIISGLLTENNAEYRVIIKEFFSLLLNEPKARKIAIIIASDLYKKFRATDTFSEEDLMSYFRKTLEGNNTWEDRFFAYDALRDCLEADDMQTESELWISGETQTSETLIMQFSRLYRLDTILETFLRFFAQYKGAGTYELWDGLENDLFPEAFESLFKSLTCENSVKNLTLLLENRNNVNQLSDRILFIEGLETRKIIMATARLDKEHLTAVSLIADIIETWFYVLTRNAGILTPETAVQPLWRAYVRLLALNTDVKTIRKIRKCWQQKVGFYMIVIQELQGNNSKKGERLNYLRILRQRRSCLRVLTTLLQTEPGYAAGNIPSTLKP